METERPTTRLSFYASMLAIALAYIISKGIFFYLGFESKLGFVLRLLTWTLAGLFILFECGVQLRGNRKDGE